MERRVSMEYYPKLRKESKSQFHSDVLRSLLISIKQNQTLSESKQSESKRDYVSYRQKKRINSSKSHQIIEDRCLGGLVAGGGDVVDSLNELAHCSGQQLVVSRTREDYILWVGLHRIYQSHAVC